MTGPVTGPVVQPEKETTDEPADTGGLPPRDGERPLAWLLPILLGLAVLLIAAAAGWWLLQPDPSPTAGDQPRRHTLSSPSKTPSRALRLPSPETSSPPAETPPPSPTTPAPTDSVTERVPRRWWDWRRTGRGDADLCAGLRCHRPDRPRDLLATADSPLPAGLLQRQRGQLCRIWNTITTATLRDIEPNPDTMGSSYIITWDPEGERGKEDEQVTLGLVEDDGRSSTTSSDPPATHRSCARPGSGRVHWVPEGHPLESWPCLGPQSTSNVSPPACTRASRFAPIAWAVVTWPAVAGLSSKARHSADSASIFAVSS